MTPVEQPIEAVREVFQTADARGLVAGNAIRTAVIKGVVGKQARQQGLRDGDGLFGDLFVARRDTAFIRFDDITGDTTAGNVIGFATFDNCLLIVIIGVIAVIAVIGIIRFIPVSRIASFSANLINGASCSVTLFVVTAGRGTSGLFDELEGGQTSTVVDAAQFFCAHHALPDSDLVELAAVQIIDLPGGIVPGATDIEIAGTGHSVAERHADLGLTVKTLTVRDEQIQGHVELAQVETDRNHRELAADQAALRCNRDQHVGHFRVILECDPVVILEIDPVGVEVICADMLLEQRHAQVIFVVRVDP